MIWSVLNAAEFIIRNIKNEYTSFSCVCAGKTRVEHSESHYAVEIRSSSELERRTKFLNKDDMIGNNKNSPCPIVSDLLVNIRFLARMQRVFIIQIHRIMTNNT